MNCMNICISFIVLLLDDDGGGKLSWFLSNWTQFHFLRFYFIANYRNTHVMAVSSVDIAPSKRSRGLSDIDPKFVSNVSVPII